ncbi:LppM family (lipo)protein [Gordonia sp. NPDC003376]
MSTVRPSSTPPSGTTAPATRPSSRRTVPRSRPRVTAVVLTAILLLAAPLLSGCLERSTTVGDRMSGSVIVATTPDNPSGPPRLDVPESMAGQVSVSEYKEAPSADSPQQQQQTDATAGDAGAIRVGSRVTFSNLTAGQFSQFGDIVANAFGDNAMTMDLSAKRSGDVVRFRGSSDLTGLVAGRDYLKLSVSFAGPITATNGEQSGDTSVSWTPEPGAVADFTADATYPDPATAAFGGWSWLMGLLCLAVVLVVARLAYVTRDRSPRPGRPAAAPEKPRKSENPTAPKDAGVTEPGSATMPSTSTASGSAGSDSR